jgi:uncharacterized cupin superfamily protein
MHCWNCETGLSATEGEKAVTDETHPKMPVFRSLDVPESNFTSYAAAHRAINQSRFNRRLGDHAGLQNYGVNLTRIIPGGQSSYRHAHSHQDEFVFVLEGKVVLETNAGAQTLTKGMCAGFPAGTGDAHRFVNRSDTDVLLLVVGGRTPGDEITYPDVDMHATLGPDGQYRFTTRAGRSHETSSGAVRYRKALAIGEPATTVDVATRRGGCVLVTPSLLTPCPTSSPLPKVGAELGSRAHSHC